MYLSKLPSGIYYIYYRKSNGNKTRKSTGCKLKKDALKFLNDFERKITEKPSKKRITLGEFTEQYLAAIKITHTEKSHYLSKNCMEKFVEFKGENTLLIEVNRRFCEKFILDTYKRTKYSAALQLRHLFAAFNKAIAWEYIEKNPLKGIKLRIPENRPIYISKDELITIVKNESNEILKFIYIFAFNTGARLGEIVNLQWQDVYFEKKEIKIRNKTTHTIKGKRERTIPMTIAVQDILNSMYSEKKEDYLFLLGNNKFKESYISKKFKKCVRMTNLNQSIHFHSLRHSFASNLVQKGCDLYVVKTLMGHENISVTQRYAHLNQANLIDGVSLLD